MPYYFTSWGSTQWEVPTLPAVRGSAEGGAAEEGAAAEGAASAEESAMEGTEEGAGGAAPPTPHALNKAAVGLLEMGRVEEAEVLFWESLALSRRTLGEEHPGTLLSVNNLIGVLFERGRLEGAESLCREALAVSRRTLGEEHPQTIAFEQSLRQLTLLLMAPPPQIKGKGGGTLAQGRKAPHSSERPWKDSLRR